MIVKSVGETSGVLGFWFSGVVVSLHPTKQSATARRQDSVETQ